MVARKRPSVVASPCPRRLKLGALELSCKQRIYGPAWAKVVDPTAYQSLFTSRWVFESKNPKQQRFGFTLFAREDDCWQFWTGNGRETWNHLESAIRVSLTDFEWPARIGAAQFAPHYQPYGYSKGGTWQVYGYPLEIHRIEAHRRMDEPLDDSRLSQRQRFGNMSAMAAMEIWSDERSKH